MLLPGHYSGITDTEGGPPGGAVTEKIAEKGCKFQEAAYGNQSYRCRNEFLGPVRVLGNCSDSFGLGFWFGSGAILELTLVPVFDISHSSRLCWLRHFPSDLAREGKTHLSRGWGERHPLQYQKQKGGDQEVGVTGAFLLGVPLISTIWLKCM